MIILLFVVLFFALAYAATWNLCREQLDRDEASQEEDAGERPADAARACRHGIAGPCLACAAEVRRSAREEREVVAELERLIGSETATVNRLLRRPDREDLHHLYVN